jgi:hypothetical protein
MASWAAVLAWTGFHYSAVTRTLTVGPRRGRFFWSSGHAWGDYAQAGGQETRTLSLRVLEGKIALARVTLSGFGTRDVAPARALEPGDELRVTIDRDGRSA